METQRFIRRHNVTKFANNPFFPVNTLMLMRGAVAAQFESMFDAYFRAAYHHMWVEPKKMDDVAVFRDAFISSGIDIDRLVPARAGRCQEKADRRLPPMPSIGGLWFADILCRSRKCFSARISCVM